MEAIFPNNYFTKFAIISILMMNPGRAIDIIIVRVYLIESTIEFIMLGFIVTIKFSLFNLYVLTKFQVLFMYILLEIVV